MKRLIKLFYIFLILFSTFTIPVNAEDNTKYGIVETAKGINVRDGAGTSHNIIGTGISDNQVVTIYETINTDDGTSTCASGTWFKIKYLQVEEGYGYACSSFIRVLDVTIDDEFEAAILTFPESYRESLRILHAIYPNAVFRTFNTGLDFKDVVENESVIGKSLLWDSNNSRDGLKHLDSYDYKTNTFNNSYPGGGKNWYAASEETIAYYIDPRNFLDETRIFMFESLSYNPMYHNKEGVEATLKSSFMYDAYVDGKKEKKFSDVIMEAGINYGISPYYIASRILQETGYTRSSLVLGKYPDFPEYNGYYNFFNFNATGTEIVKNGLEFAKNKGWNSEEKAIIGGASLIGTNYIKAGQDNNYFQKWNVVCKTGDYSCYTHQYMQNIEAPYSEALSTYKAYSNSLKENMYNVGYVFTIPVYENMPSKTVLPNLKSPINYLKSLIINKTEVANFNSLTLDYSITIPSYMTSINIEATSMVKGTSISGIGSIDITKDKQVIPIKVTALNGNVLTYNITVNINDDYNMTLEETISNIKQGNIFDNYISGLTSVDIILSSITKANSAAIVTVLDNNGNFIDSGSVGTGYKVKIMVGEESKVFDIVIYGDNNGDNSITILDLLRIQKHLLGSLNLTDSYLKSCDINKDDKVDILDLLLIQKHLLGAKLIVQ